MFRNSCCETPLRFQGLVYKEQFSSYRLSHHVASSRFMSAQRDKIQGFHFYGAYSVKLTSALSRDTERKGTL